MVHGPQASKCSGQCVRETGKEFEQLEAAESVLPPACKEGQLLSLKGHLDLSDILCKLIILSVNKLV